MIIRLSGLPGSGKSTLGEMLSEELGYKLFRIDHYRNKYQDEFTALIRLFEDIMEAKDNFIIDSTGFNPRIHWIFQFIPVRVVDIKLLCEAEILKDRIKTKVLPKDEYFPYTDVTRETYIDDFFADMIHKPADFVVDTSHITKVVMLKCTLDNLNFYSEGGK